jgi:hypothetical protein
MITYLKVTKNYVSTNVAKNRNTYNLCEVNYLF